MFFSSSSPCKKSTRYPTRIHSRQRYDIIEELSLSVSRLENRCGVLEDTLKMEQEAVHRENAKATAAESNFETLLAWARQEERRRREAQEGQLRASERATVLEARAAAAEQEVRVDSLGFCDRTSQPLTRVNALHITFFEQSQCGGIDGNLLCAYASSRSRLCKM